MSQITFENRKLKINYIEKYITDTNNRTYIFDVDIKDFDTPILSVEYSENEEAILRTWIRDEESDNAPKNHVVYKLFSLIEFEVFEIMKFMIKHI
ncbi:hypothetical protein CHF27_007175 [Romboutsia maritimum]|uniref:Uncharacterized protein n=1 Tax=Romboutsia maritimum TaxID=2020948 RepID=A0A371IT98_9FIRM|nr:hypothetical protein [Romboutsia maritimum]RDY23707.1 hypothetical protein CHF27_007175 [Romboutsia maritimum]